MKTRSAMVQQAEAWLGLKESDGSYKKIIDTYNSYKGILPRGIKMQYGWPWCACTWSALGIKLGYTDIIPLEISCGFLIAKAKEMGIWQENDAYVPKPGDAILYDWDDSGKGDNTAWPDHVGTVEWVSKDSGYFIVIEGNYNGQVKKRTVSVNGKFIRGFIVPKYDEEGTVAIPGIGTSKDIDTVAREVIAGVYGNGDSRKKAVEANGINYSEVQKRVNEILNGSAAKPKDDQIPNQDQPIEKYVMTTCYAKSSNNLYAGTYKTTANLYCRNDAGSNKKALCLIPAGMEVKNYGFYTVFNGVRWLLIQFVMDGVRYTGFSSSEYLKKI